MARKATDLLDVFRYGGGDDDDNKSRSVTSRARGAKARGSKSKTTAKGGTGGKGFDGLILTRRQMILAGSACCLLVALSFVLGLSAGRPSAEEDPAMARQAARANVSIRVTLPRVHPTNQKEIDPAEVRRLLVDDYAVPANALRVGVDGGRLVVEIGMFRTEEDARGYLRRSGLESAKLYGTDPFLWPQIGARSR